MSKEIFPRDKIFHRCCGFLLALFGSLFCFVFVFVFFLGGGGWGEKGVLCFVSVLVSFFSFQFSSFFLQECLNHLISVEGKPSHDPKLRFETGDLERKRF